MRSPVATATLDVGDARVQVVVDQVRTVGPGRERAVVATCRAERDVHVDAEVRTGHVIMVAGWSGAELDRRPCEPGVCTVTEVRRRRSTSTTCRSRSPVRARCGCGRPPRCSNYNEVDGCRGRYLTVNPPLPYTLGMEVLGVVDAAGAGAETLDGRRVVGDRAGAFGAHAEAVIAPVDMVFDAPARSTTRARPPSSSRSTSRTSASTSAGGCSRARPCSSTPRRVASAPRRCSWRAPRARPCSRRRAAPEKVEFVRGLGADVVIDYRADDFVAAVDDATDGVGVDVVFDGVGGDVGDRSLDCLARNGRYLIVGLRVGHRSRRGRDGDAAPLVLRPLLGPRRACCRTRRTRSRPAGDRFQHHAARRRRRGAHAIDRAPRDAGRDPARSWAAKWTSLDLPAALDAMEHRATIGRVVVARGLSL